MTSKMQDAGDQRYWRVFYTASRAEKKCEERLAGQALEVFLPKYVATHQWKDRQKKVVEPLFRNYIFARVDERERLSVLQTTGIVRCLSFDGRMVEVPEEEIEQLRITQNDPERLLLFGPPVPGVGEAAEIVEGPLRGLRGVVIEHRGQRHLLVHVQSIRQVVRVQVPREWVRPHGVSRAA